MSKPTSKQQAVLATISTYNRKGVKPTLRQLADDLNYKSMSGVQRHIDALRFKGMVAPSDNRHGVTVISEVDADTLREWNSIKKDLEWLKELRIHNPHGDDVSEAVIEQVAWYVLRKVEL